MQIAKQKKIYRNYNRKQNSREEVNRRNRRTMRNINMVNTELSCYLQRQLNQLNPHLNMWVDAKRSIGMRSEQLWIQRELQSAKVENLMVRRKALKHHLEAELNKIEKELETMGLAHTPVQP